MLRAEPGTSSWTLRVKDGTCSAILTVMSDGSHGSDERAVFVADPQELTVTRVPTAVDVTWLNDLGRRTVSCLSRLDRGPNRALSASLGPLTGP
jgi:hypothetical protein